MKNIFVDNLNFDIAEDTVRSRFAEYGTVERVNILTDCVTEQARGFGFIELDTDAATHLFVDNNTGRVGYGISYGVHSYNGRPVSKAWLMSSKARTKKRLY